MRQRVFEGIIKVEPCPLVLGTNGDVNDVEDDAEAAGDYEQDADDFRLSCVVRVDDGRGLTDVHWLNPASYDHVLLLHLDDWFLEATQPSTQTNQQPYMYGELTSGGNNFDDFREIQLTKFGAVQTEKAHSAAEHWTD